MDRPQLELSYATPSAESVAALAVAQFGLPAPIRCALLSRGFNDCFELTAKDNRRYVLRISGRRLRGMADARSETEFLRHLVREGILVSTPVAMIAGSFWTSVALPQGECPVVLFDYIEGRAPDQRSLADASAQGTTLARIHNAAANFTQDSPCRYRLDLEHLLHRPLRAIFALDNLSAATHTGLSELAQRLAAAVAARDDLESTYCHGDCHGYNAHILTEGPRAGEAAFFDFDDGGPGYLAYDLAVFLWASVSFGRRGHDKWRAFVAGYRALRPESEVAIEAAHLFVPIRHIWVMGEYAARTTEWGSRSAPAEWISSQLEFMRAWEARTIQPGLF